MAEVQSHPATSYPLIRRSPMTAVIMLVKRAEPFLPYILVVVTVLGFLPALGNGFINWGDAENFADNGRYRELNWNNLAWMFTTAKNGHYQPLAWLTFALDYRLWKLDPFGYHLSSLLLHGANAGLLYFLTVQLLARVEADRNDFETAVLRWATAGAVLLFALHPMRVETVAWASTRNLLLTDFFFLVAVFNYLRATQYQTKSLCWKWLGAALGAHVFSILCGANGLALPVLLLLLDVCPLGRLQPRAKDDFWPGLSRILLEKLPFVIFAAAGIFNATRLRTDIAGTADLPDTSRLEWFARALCQPIFYLWKTAVPNRLLPAYELPEVISTGEWIFFIGGFILITLSVAVLRFRTGRIAPSIGWICYLILVFVPRIQSGPDGAELLADRYSYLPSLVLALAIATALHSLVRMRSTDKARRIAFAAGGGVFLINLLLGILTWRQLDVWHDGERLWRYAVTADPYSRQARQKLAEFLFAQDRDSEAKEVYRQAAELHPDSALAQTDFARVLAADGKLPEAMASYHRALNINPNLVQALLGLGNVFVARGELDDAIKIYNRALISGPSASAHVNLGVALAKQGKLNEAIQHYQTALALDVNNVNAYVNLANAETVQGRAEQAIANYRRALELRPNHGRVHFALASVLETDGHLKEAMEHYQEAINLEPEFAASYVNVGKMLANQGQLDTAIQYYRHALGLKPNLADARLNLAKALVAQGRKQEALHEYEEAKRLLQDGGSSPATRERNRG